MPLDVRVLGFNYDTAERYLTIVGLFEWENAQS
jgi:hypothetical protein